MVRPNDQFWVHVKKMDSGLKCKFCGFKFAESTSISRIKSHFSGVEGLGINVCKEVPDDVKAAACLAIQSANKRLRLTMPSSSNTEVRNTASASSIDQTNQVENGARDAGMVQREVQSMGQELREGREQEDWTEIIEELMQHDERVSSPKGSPVDAQEIIGNALQTTDLDLVDQAIPKPWHEIESFLMQNHMLTNGADKTTGELMQPIRPDIPGAHAYETRRVALPTTKIVGQALERSKDVIWSWLMKDEVLNIGVYGMGGVGKTTLMTHVHNQLGQTPNSFTRVYWVTISQDFSICKLQNRIAKTIGLDLSNEDDEMQRAAKLFEGLMGKRKSVIILDDLWNSFDVEKVGIPIGVNECKLILTTRLLDVCRSMGCGENIIKVEPLSREEAWNLFMKEMGKYEVKLEPLAKLVASECAGLPLGIKLMARSMRGVVDVFEWRNALRELKESKFMKYEMGDGVFKILEFSYNHLKDPALQQCFLYCALFPEDFEIRREDLIEHMIDEGIIEAMRRRQEKIDKGHAMLNKLENACLLEKGYRRSVKMHDLIRDMALHKLRENSRVMVEAGAQLTELPDDEKWTEDLMTVSLMRNNIKQIPSSHSPKCPNLSTLLLCNTWPLKLIEDSFFKQLLGLKVLDLSFTSIERLPDSISDLVSLTALRLRECENLRHVPSLEKLRALKKLDLGGVGLEEVPQGLEFLSNLRHLDVNSPKLKEFPAGILPNLLDLQFLYLYHMTRVFTVKGEEVACLTKLEYFVCCFSDLVDFNKFVKSWKKRPPLSYYHFVIDGPETEDEDNYEFEANKKVVVCGCTISRGGGFLVLPKDIQDLTLLKIRCEARSLSDVCGLEYATELKFLSLDGCEGMESLLSFPLQNTFNILESLEYLTLECVVNLRVLFHREDSTTAPRLPVPSDATFSRLKDFTIYGCHNMKNLFLHGLLSNLQNLEMLVVNWCERMEEIIATEETGIVGEESNNHYSIEFSLPKLTGLHLWKLPELKSICCGTMICNSLRTIGVRDCEKLKRMPLSLPLLENGQPSPPPSLFKIDIRPKEWWESVEWEHPNAKNVLLPLCVFR